MNNKLAISVARRRVLWGEIYFFFFNSLKLFEKIIALGLMNQRKRKIENVNK